MALSIFDGMAKLSINSAGKDVLASGTVQTFDKKHLEFRLGNLAFIFIFENDARESRIETEPAQTSIKIKCYNINSLPGLTVIEPMNIGTFNGRRLYFAFSVSAFQSESLKVIQYTFYSGEPVNG